MNLPSNKYSINSRIVSGTPQLYPNDSVLLCDTSSAGVTINLPVIPANYWNTTWKLYVIDNSNNAGTNNIVVNAGSGQKINNASSVTISTNNGYGIIRICGNNDFLFESSAGSGGGITTITGTDTATADTTVTPISGGFDIKVDVIPSAPTQLSAEITFVSQIGDVLTLTVNGNIIGGAPAAYEWKIPTRLGASGSNIIMGETADIPIITTGGTTDTVSIQSAAGSTPSHVFMGLISCKITDTLGRITYAYYFSVLNTPI